MAKELIESCCMTVLDELGIPYTKNDDVPQLADKTMSVLNLLPSYVQSTDRGADAIKAVLGNLRAIPTKLAVGSSITFVDFIWSTYESTKH